MRSALGGLLARGGGWHEVPVFRPLPEITLRTGEAHHRVTGVPAARGMFMGLKLRAPGVISGEYLPL
jgi:hypothetical protein